MVEVTFIYYNNKKFSDFSRVGSREGKMYAALLLPLEGQRLFPIDPLAKERLKKKR